MQSPLLSGLASGYAFVPPSAGSVLVANALGVNLGTMIMVGIPTALICMLVSGIIWSGFIGNKIFTELPANVGEIKDDGKELPSFGLVLGVILIPLVLILLSTLSKYMPLPAGVQDVLGFLGKPFLALTIATLAAMYFLGIRRGFSGAQLKKILDHSLRPVGMILLVIASGGVIRWMLQDSGLGNIIGPALEKSGLPLILIAFFIAILVRASVGSSIVAMTMASGIMATMPAVMDTSMLYRAAMCCAICGGATALSHVNDAGFWLVGTFLEIDEKTTLKSWTIMETLIGVTALIVSLVISNFCIGGKAKMVKIPVYLRDMYDAKHLVQIAESCRGDVDLLCGRYVVDAKSMLGVFSLPTFEQVEISVGEEEAEFAREKLESLNLIRK